MANLDAYTSIKTNLFVRLQVDQYRTTSTGSYVQEVLRFSDFSETFTINGESYVPLGELLGVTASVSEIRPSSNTLTLTISGIPTDSIAEIRYSKIKGAPIKIYRGWFNTLSGNQIGEIEGKFFGLVNNYAIGEEYDIDSRTASNFIELECATSVDILGQKLAGRKTNPQSQQRFYPNDLSMNRVPVIKSTKFNFGAQE